jgi:hypothetical protein
VAKNGLFVLGQYSEAPWGVPSAEIAEFGGLATAADTALANAMSNESTHAVTVACRLAFEALKTKMRFFKSHYFPGASLATPR